MCLEACPYRTRETGDDNGPGDNRFLCRLPPLISGTETGPVCRIGQDVCKACSRTYPPSTTHINPVVASLLHKHAEQILEAGGVPGCDAGKAAGILHWAELNLEVSTTWIQVDFQELERRGVASECLYLGEPLPLEEAEKDPSSGDSLDGRVYTCRHPRHSRTTVDDCRRCRDWMDSPRDETDLLKDIPLPEVPAAEGRRLERWVVAMTTAPRQLPTVDWSLDSVVRAGWNDVRIFMDTPVDLATRHSHHRVSLRTEPLGAWPSYYVMLVELLMREPDADAYFVVQDDVILYDREDLREYVEGIRWPADMGVVSLYCSSVYTQEDSGWYPFQGSWVWGAQALVFPRESVKRIVTDAEVLEHRWVGKRGGRANIDTLIGKWAVRNGLHVYFPTPSLAQHIGETSTLWPMARVAGRRRADRFPGDVRYMRDRTPHRPEEQRSG